MFRLTKFQLTFGFIALMLLRVVVGYHFYKEGTNKLKSGTFTSKYFLSGAKGPLAPMFKGMLEDADGSQQLCVVKSTDPSGYASFEVDPELTILLWKDYLDQAANFYGFGSKELQQELASRRAQLAQQIQTARENQNTAVDTAELEAERKRLEQDILRLRSQLADANQVLENHVDQLTGWLAYYEVDLISHFETADRLDGFERDGEHREEAALFVDSLRYQVDQIRSDRQKKLNGWTAEVTAMWDSYEQKINDLALPEQRRPQISSLPIHRPFDEPWSFYKVVDVVIPWFDTIVGISLILGLLTRFSSFFASLFLISVILTQPPWIPGTDPTYFYFIELMALLVIFATGAGRFGGLDYFLDPTLYRPPPAAEESVSSNPSATAETTRQPKGQLA